MDTRPLERFAQAARRRLTDQVTARLELVLHGDSADLRARAAAVQKLRAEIATNSRAAVVERVAYTWFNRFCALCFMDANHYTPLGIVSPAPGSSQPEILQEAKAGQIDPLFAADAERVRGLLDERIPAPDPQQEAYRLLIVAACNHYHSVMPFLFEPIADYTELLMPDDLLSANSVLHALHATLSEEVCRDVEVIGWLYQFYIAEKKEAVDAKVKAGGKVAADELPAKTALYTPHWIVRFLVENSLGRLWLLNHPTSRLAERMAYYLAPEEPVSDYLRISTPEELRVCDSACGSGHMLTYAFDLLYAIYEEEGYNPPDIPRLILQKNLYGMEIDERSGALAAFALSMKARTRDSRFFRRGVHPNVCVLHPVHFKDAELDSLEWLQALGSTLIDLPLRDALLADLRAFVNMDSIGSLLRPQLRATQVAIVQARIAAASDLFNQELNDRISDVLRQVAYLAKKYDVVVTNPPYLGKGMDEALADFARNEYPDSKSDTFAMFIERNMTLAGAGGMVAMITMQSWMFLSSYEKLRNNILDRHAIVAMAHLGAHAFDSIGGEVVSATAFVICVQASQANQGVFIRLVQGSNEAEKEAELINVVSGQAEVSCYRAAAADFKKIPGSPIAYWAPEDLIAVFGLAKQMDQFLEPREGLTTGNNERYVRFWYEVNLQRIGRQCRSRDDAKNSGSHWFPYSKGGEYRKWAGNDNWIVNWYNDGEELQTRLHPSGSRIWAHNFNLDYIFREFISWSDITTKGLTVRFFDAGYLFDAAGLSAFRRTNSGISEFYAAAICNSKVGGFISFILNPTMHFKSGDFAELPVVIDNKTHKATEARSVQAVKLASEDWHTVETSWKFMRVTLLQCATNHNTLSSMYTTVYNYWKEVIYKVRDIEQENNRDLLPIYGLQDELTPDVPLSEITLTCNPHYRYGGARSEEELERLLRADTMRELISYAAGCMFGRYSLDKPGLILANQGETLEEYLRQVPTPTFVPDKDNVIPILAGDWFPDDAPERFKRFLRLAFGDEYFAENLAFVENAIGRDIRAYFLRDFYDHHLKLYQKRPIYWLFSSPKGSFNALIYMHRYRPDTVSVVLNDYLRAFVAKLAARRAHLQQLAISTATPAADKSRALKETGEIDKMLAELTAYENDVLYPLATQQVQIDLDDGVKVNYAKFGKALRRVPGLSE